jgi:hypothetical protein
MSRTTTLVHAVIAATLIWAAGCADAPDATEDDGSRFELAPETTVQPPPETDILIGCSNAQIRSAQNACRNFFCGTRGSNGIHFCDQRPAQGIVVAQCDCKTGADPQIQCSLTDCPQ